MRRTMIGLAFILAMMPAASALVPLPTCDDRYEACISNCCQSCGSSADRNAQGGLECEIGSANAPNQACLDACMPCSNQYQQCMVMEKSNGEGQNAVGGGSCCAGAEIPLGLAGFTIAKDGKRDI